jgi:WD40 repeat protein
LGRPRQTDRLTGATCLSANGKVLANGNGAIHLLEAASGKELRRLRERGRRSGNPVAFSPDGKVLAAETREGLSGENAGVYLWDVKSGKCLHVIETQEPKRIEVHVFSPDGRFLVLENRFGAGDTVFWYTDKGERVELPSGRLGRSTFAFSASGRWLAALTREDWPVQEIHFLEAATGQVVRRLKGQTHLTCCDVSPDGRLLVTGGKDGVVRLWDPAAGKEVRQLRGHQGGIYSVAFAPDGKRLISGSADTTVLVWDMAGVKPR